MYLAVREGVAAPPLGVEICQVVGHAGQSVVDLVVEGYFFIGEAFQCYACGAAERHLPVAVEAAVGIDRDGKGADVAVLAPAVAEEVAQGNLDSRLRVVIPVAAKEQ